MVESISLDPRDYDSMQEYAGAIADCEEIVDPLINRLAKGLQAGVHDSPSEKVFEEHTTVRYGEEEALHYEDESGAWRDFAD
ncbi:MAG: hypothetical protein ABEJ36_02810 [Candidatus Nanosalina sp.]